MNSKTLLILIISFILNISCLSQKKDLQLMNSNHTKNENQIIKKIELTEKTRGTNRLFTFTKNLLSKDINGEKTTSILSSLQWKNILQITEMIDLQKISTYKSPTTARYSDAALASTIIITVDDKKYNSSDFDKGKAPKELEALYNELQKIEENMK